MRSGQFSMSPEELAKFLSEQGWVWSTDYQGWRKNGHAISEEATRDILALHEWFIPFFRREIARGAVGFSVTTEDDPILPRETGPTLRVRWEYPDRPQEGVI